MDTAAALPHRTLKERLEAYERRLIMAALAGADGVQHQAALSLGVRPTTLHEKIKRLGIGVVRHVVRLDRPDQGARRRAAAEPRSPA